MAQIRDYSKMKLQHFIALVEVYKTEFVLPDAFLQSTHVRFGQRNHQPKITNT